MKMGWVFFSVLALSMTTFAADTAAPAPAAAFKLGYVDVQKAVGNLEAGKSAKAALEKEFNAKKAALEKQQGDLQKEVEQFEKKAAILNDAAKEQKRQELQKKYMEFQKGYGESQMELQKREREVFKPVLDELRAVIESFGKEKGFTLIVEKNDGAVLYAASGEDLTDAVVERFNQKNKGKAKKG